MQENWLNFPVYLWWDTTILVTFDHVQAHECHIDVIFPTRKIVLRYKTLDDGVEALCKAFLSGGFNEAFIGDHRLEVYSVDPKGSTILQMYFSEEITHVHMNGLKSTAIW